MSEAAERIQRALEEGATHLDLSHLYMDDLPASIGQLQGLRSLALSENQLTDLPPELWQLHGLEELDLGSNWLLELPAGIGQLTSLRELSVSGNDIYVQLPDSIGALRALEVLDDDPGPARVACRAARRARAQTLERVREAMAAPEYPNVLNLSGMGLTWLPDEVAERTGLEVLELGDNALTELPAALQGLEQLSVLNLERNCLATVPGWVGKLPMLEELYLERNPLTSLPPEVDREDDRAILAWLRDN